MIPSALPIAAATFACAAVLTSLVGCSQTESTPEAQRDNSVQDGGLHTFPGRDDHSTISSDRSAGAGGPVLIASRAKLTEQKKQAVQDLISKLADATTLDEAFLLAEQIEEYGQGAAPLLEAKLGEMSNTPQIAALRTLYNLAEWDTAVNGLIKIVRADTERDDRLAAADLLSELASTRHKEALGEALKNVFDVEVKIEVALALWRSSKDTLAKKALYDLLESDSETFRIKAALALGRLGDLTRAGDILEVLASEPTSRGEIAELALQRESLLRVFARVMERVPAGSQGRIKIDTAILEEVADMIQDRYIYQDRSNRQRLMLEAASGMLQGLDPYTTYLNETQMRRASDIREFRVPSLGISIGAAPIREGRNFRVPKVISVMPGSPAARAGLRPGDQIRNVAPGATREKIAAWRTGVPLEDGESLADEFFDMRLGDQVSSMYDVAGASTGILIFRDDWILPQWVRMTHAAPVEAQVRHQMLPGKLGYIRIGSLNADAPSDFKAAFAELTQGEAQGLLLDLRDTSNGSIEAMVQIASMLLPADSLVTWSHGRTEVFGARKEYSTSGEFRDVDLPLTVLINGGTADAAEILAGALQDYGRAKLAGSLTFGRAIAQEMMTFEALVPDADDEKKMVAVNHALLITVARFHTPTSKRVIYDAGVKPDVFGEQASFEGWVYEELDTLRDRGAFDEYLEALMSEHPDKALELAKGDAGDPSKYPELSSKLMAKDLHLEPEHLRWAVRRKLRMSLIQSGKLTDVADLQEDQEFVAGLRALAKQSGVDLTKFEEYKWVSTGEEKNQG